MQIFIAYFVTSKQRNTYTQNTLTQNTNTLTTMSTRCTIAFRQDDGSIKVAYCHRNGALNNTGAALLQHFNTPETAKVLEAAADRLGEFLGFDGHIAQLADGSDGQFRTANARPKIVSNTDYMQGGWDYGQSDVSAAYLCEEDIDGSILWWCCQNGEKRNYKYNSFVFRRLKNLLSI